MTLNELREAIEALPNDDQAKIPASDIALIAIHHLLNVWLAYGRGNEKDENISLPHNCMQAGEQACDFLENLGLATDSGWYCDLTDLGKKLLYKDASE